MSVETDSPDHGRGNPDHPDAEQAAAPQSVATAAAPAPTTDPSMDDPAPGASVPPPRGNGGSDPIATAGGHPVLPPPVGPPLPGPTVPGPFTGPPVGLPRPVELDTAAGLPSPYARSGPVVRRPPRHRRAARLGRAPTEGRRVVHRLRQVSPWSVFKVVVLFYLCVFLMFMVAGVLLWRIGRSTETIDQLEGLVTRLGAYGECVPEAEVEAGTDFEADEDCPDGEVIVDGFRFNDGTLFRSVLLAGAIFVVAGTVITVLLTVLLNLLNDVTGGVRYETLREPSADRTSNTPGGPDPGPPLGRERGRAAAIGGPPGPPWPPVSRSIGP